MGEIDPRDLLPAPIQRVRLRNFRSIRGCDVTLGNLTVLVGPNASGKSNFLDALQFTRDALDSRLDYALRTRDGFDDVCHKPAEVPSHFSVRIDLAIPRVSAMYDRTSFYAFEIGVAPGGGCVVRREAGEHVTAGSADAFERVGDHVRIWGSEGEIVQEAPASDDLFLPRAGVVREVLDQLKDLIVYAFDPVAMRQPQRSGPHEALVRDGHNLGGVLRKHPSSRVIEYLSTIVPGVESVEGVQVGGYDTFQISQRSDGGRGSTFSAASMSDGTLRALAVLVALMTDSLQPRRPRPGLIAIEEIEAGLHPGAVGVLWDALCEASLKSQVIVSTHSPDLLDRDDLENATLLGVSSQEGRTVIGSPSKADLGVLQKKLCTAGELMRQVRLQPDWSDADPSGQDMFRLSRAATWT